MAAIFYASENISRLTGVKKEIKQYNLPVNDEVEAVKNMHLIGQAEWPFVNGVKMGENIFEFVRCVKTIFRGRKL